MLRALHIDPEKCTGCNQCLSACSQRHEGGADPAKSRIQVLEFGRKERFVPYTCTQCSEAWCQKACPTEAISVNAAGAKVVDEALCVGCKICTIACPFGTVNYNADTGKVIKCDLCDGAPACVEVCPTGALMYVDANMTGYQKMRAWAVKPGDDGQITA